MSINDNTKIIGIILFHFLFCITRHNIYFNVLRNVFSFATSAFKVPK